jgi:hypothetical protein
MRWAGHVARMGEKGNQYRVLWEIQKDIDNEECKDVLGGCYAPKWHNDNRFSTLRLVVVKGLLQLI